MGKPAEFKLTGSWRKFAATVDPAKLGPALQTNLQRATIANGLYVVAEIKRRIRLRKYERNSPFTILLKRSSAPLVDDSDLFNAFTHQILDSRTVFVGVLRSARDGDGRPLANVAEILHQGGVIQVTMAMRNMFKLLAAVGAGEASKSELTGRAAEIAARLKGRIKQIKPLKESTKALVIPPRPFIRAVFKDPKVLKKVRKTWEKAVQATLQSTAEKAPPGPGPRGSGGDKAGGGAAGGAGGAGGGKASKRSRSPKPRGANRSEAAKKGWASRRAKSSKAKE